MQTWGMSGCARTGEAGSLIHQIFSGPQLHLALLRQPSDPSGAFKSHMIVCESGIRHELGVAGVYANILQRRQESRDQSATSVRH